MPTIIAEKKAEIRKSLRAARREFVEALSPSMQALLFKIPPRPVLDLIGDRRVIGLYHAGKYEAPTARYAAYFYENGYTLALPYFAEKGAAMEFREWSDPIGNSDLEADPYGVLQPSGAATMLVPDVLIMPLVGFTAACDRLGQGGGHYDRFIAANPGALRIGLAWDVQEAESLPTESHDMPLHMVVTQTRFIARES